MIGGTPQHTHALIGGTPQTRALIGGTPHALIGMQGVCVVVWLGRFVNIPVSVVGVAGTIGVTGARWCQNAVGEALKKWPVGLQRRALNLDKHG